MALTNTQTSRGGTQPSAPSISLELSVLTDASYPNPAGYAFDPAEELREKGGYDKPPVIIGVVVASKAGHTFEWDRTLNALHIFTPAGVEIANGVDIAAALGGPTTALILAE